MYGANDSRLMDRYKNVYQIESPKDGSYIKLELDVSALDGTTRRHGQAARLPRRVHAYRLRVDAVPLVRDRRPSVVDAANKHGEHVVEFRSAVRPDHASPSTAARR